MVKMYCNKCNEEIKGTTYFTINIYANDVSDAPTASTASSTTTAYNIQTYFSQIFHGQKHYCEKCKNKIEKFINSND